MTASQLPTQQGEENKMYGKVLWQELISWSAKRSKKNALTFNVRYCTLKNKKGTFKKTIFNFFNCWMPLWLGFEGSSFSPFTDTFFHSLIFFFANHLQVLCPLVDSPLWRTIQMGPMLESHRIMLGSTGRLEICRSYFFSSVMKLFLTVSKDMVTAAWSMSSSLIVSPVGKENTHIS